MENKKEKELVNIWNYKNMGINFSFDDMIKVLLEAKEKGDLVYCEFNGHYFCSNTLTSVDEAYLDYHDMTKEEYTYYSENSDSIAISLIGSIFKLALKDGMFEEYTKDIICLRAPAFLQILDYLIRNCVDIMCDTVNEEKIERFSQFNEERNKIARDFLDKWCKEDYKEMFLEKLSFLKEVQK